MWAANGSNEILQQLLQAFGGPGRTALGFEPSYSMHPLIAMTTGTRWLSGARDGDFGLDPDHAVAVVREVAADLVFLTSPNNPTGTALPLEVIEAVCAAAPGMVVVDEAYAEFARDASRDRAHPAARLPAARGHPHHVQGVRAGRGPGRLPGGRPGGAAGAAAGPAALPPVRADPGGGAGRAGPRRELLATVAALRAQRDGLVAWLRGRGLHVADSDANFVLFGEFRDRHAIWQALLDRGVLIRETGPAGWLRVTAGTPAEMAAFRDALDGVLAGLTPVAPAGRRAR